jgi:hypothetical protein
VSFGGAVGGVLRPSSLFAQSLGGDVTVSNNISTSGAGDSIVLVASGNFVNSGGAAYAPGTGRWLIYSTDFSLDTRTGLAYAFKQYGATYGVTPVAGTGNGFLYTTAHTVTPNLGGTASKVYDASTAAPTTFLTLSPAGAVDGDTVVLAITGATYDTAHAGSGKTVTASISASATNGAATVYGYQISPASAAVGDITPAPLTVSLTNTGVTKGYDGSTTASFTPTYSVTGGFVSGDTAASFSATGKDYNSSHVTLADRVSVSGVAVSSITGSNGSLASDYSVASTLTSAAASASITPAPVTATLANTGVTKVYDGSAGTTAVASYTVLGQLGTDTVNVSTGSLAYNTSHVVGSDHLVASGLTVGGVTGSTFTSASLASDYALSSATVTSAPGSAAITPAPLTVRANDASRPVSQPNPPFSASYSGLQAGDSPSSLAGSVVFATLANAGSAAGNYLVTPSGVSSANYSIVFVDGTLRVFGTTALIPDPLATAHGVMQSPVATGAVSLSTPSGRGIYAAGSDDEPGAEFLNGLPATAAGLSEGEALAPIDTCNNNSPIAVLRCTR